MPEETATAKIERRSEKAGIFNFAREMISALLMAFVAIVYVIQAFKIPSGSMENSLLVGDFLLGLKFIYGAPVLPLDITFKKFPGVTKPKPGDVVIFKYPGGDNKDYIKRCVAGPGQTIEIHGKAVTIDGKPLALAPHGKYVHDGILDPYVSNFAPLTIPKKGSVLNIDELPTREFIFAKHLIHQEHPKAKIFGSYDLYIDGVLSSDLRVIPNGVDTFSFSQINFPQLEIQSNWTAFEDTFRRITELLAGRDVKIVKRLYMNGVPVKSYTVEFDNYFMMGDNRDNSMDSRYWGYVDANFIRAKAFILYFSLNQETPWYLLPLKIRWERIGKLIRPWDGGNTAFAH